MGNLFVKKLQNKLNQRGYNLKVDGIWGPKTKAAFMDANNRNANEAAGAYINLINNVEESMKPGPDFVPDDQGGPFYEAGNAVRNMGRTISGGFRKARNNLMNFITK